MVSPQALIELSTGYWKSRAFLTALDLGLFRALGSDGLPMTMLAEQLSVPEERLRPLVGALVELDLLEMRKESGDVCATEISNMFLNPDSPACMEGAFMYSSQMFPLWADLGPKLKEGCGQQLTPTKEQTPAFLAGMHQRAAMLAPVVLPLVELPESGKVLDIAAGAGTWSMMLSQRSPSLSFTLLEQPELAESMKSFMAQKGWSDFELIGQDYHDADLEPTHDVVLYFGALHQEPMARLQQVLETCWGGVAPGGKLLILDIFAQDKKGEDLFAWLFGLNMLLTTEGSVMVLSEVEAACAKLADQAEVSSSAVPGDLPYHLIQVKKSV